MEWTESRDKLQNNLRLIRKAGNWSGEKFGKILGLSKQSISNLEHRTVGLSKCQYIAIRSVLDYEIEDNKNEKLKIIVAFCLDTDDISEDKYKIAQTYLEGALNSDLTAREILNGLATISNRVAANKICVSEHDSKSWMDTVIKE